MKKNIFYAVLFATSLSACGASGSNTIEDVKAKESTETATEESIPATKIEMEFNLPEKEVQKLTNATASLGESYGMSCFTFKGDNATLEVYINSFDLKEQEYPVNVEDMSTPNILVSYKISSNGETSDCCGKVEKESVGGMTITSISDKMISGTIDVDNYDGSSIKGSFNLLK